MKMQFWWQALAAVCLVAGVAISLRGHAPDNGDDRRNPRRVAGVPPAPVESPVVIEVTPDPVPPPHEVSPAPPFGFVPPPDNDPLPPPEEMDALLKPNPAGNR